MWDRAGIEFATPGSAVSDVSADTLPTALRGGPVQYVRVVRAESSDYIGCLVLDQPRKG